MKKLVLIQMIMFLLALSVNAQEFRKKLSNTSNATIKIALYNSNISIQGYDGDEIIVKAMGYEPPPERAKGLNPLYSQGVDNTGIGLSIKEEGNTLEMVKSSREDIDYEVQVPRNVSVSVEEINFMGGHEFQIENVAGEIEVSTKTSNINLKNITGPVVANSVSGSLEADFSSLNQEMPCSVSLVSGFADITLPGTTKASLKLSSVSGEVYTDFDIVLENKTESEMKRISTGRPIIGTINAGGTDFNIKVVSGNIYLRKK